MITPYNRINDDTMTTTSYYGSSGAQIAPKTYIRPHDSSDCVDIISTSRCGLPSGLI